MPLTESQQQLADRFVQLLVSSALDDSIIQMIIANIDKVPEAIIRKCVASLEEEVTNTQQLTQELLDFFQSQPQAWQNLAHEQAQVADQVMRSTVEQIKADLAEKG